MRNELKLAAQKLNEQLLLLDDESKNLQEVTWKLLGVFGAMSIELNDVIEDADAYKIAQRILELAADLNLPDRGTQIERRQKLDLLHGLIDELNQKRR